MDKPKWPTLEGRLNHPLTDELTALQQLENVLELNEFAKKKLEKLQKNEIPEKSIQKRN